MSTSHQLLALRARTAKDVQEIEKSFDWGYLPLTLTIASATAREYIFEQDDLIGAHLSCKDTLALRLLGNAIIELEQVASDYFSGLDASVAAGSLLICPDCPRAPIKLEAMHRNLLLGWIPNARIPCDGMWMSDPASQKSTDAQHRDAVRTRRGAHFYYLLKEGERRKSILGANSAELQILTRQTVAPGSEVEGHRYEYFPGYSPAEIVDVGVVSGSQLAEIRREIACISDKKSQVVPNDVSEPRPTNSESATDDLSPDQVYARGVSVGSRDSSCWRLACHFLSLRYAPEHVEDLLKTWNSERNRPPYPEGEPRTAPSEEKWIRDKISRAMKGRHHRRNIASPKTRKRKQRAEERRQRDEALRKMILMFKREAVVLDLDAWERQTDVYAAFRAFATEHGYGKCSSRVFGPLIKKLIPCREKYGKDAKRGISSQRGLFGIRLRH